MSINDKKEDILLTLQSTKDEQLIDEVYELLYPNKAVEEITLGNLPDELQNKIARALDDYKNGRYVTPEQLKQKVQQWLTN